MCKSIDLSTVNSTLSPILWVYISCFFISITLASTLPVIIVSDGEELLIRSAEINNYIQWQGSYKATQPKIYDQVLSCLILMISSSRFAVPGDQAFHGRSERLLLQ
jgi:hypothetical protein